jgi:hypothetical protein
MIPKDRHMSLTKVNVLPAIRILASVSGQLR